MVVLSAIWFLMSKLKSIDFWTFSYWLCVISLTSIILVFLKFAARRRKYSALMPGYRVGFLDPLGNLNTIPLKESSRNGYSFHVILFQSIRAGAELFRKESMYCLWVSFSPFVVLIKPEAIEAVIGNSKHLNKSTTYSMMEPWLGKGLLTNHGDKYKARRKLIMPSFHIEILMNFIPVFNQQAQVLVKVLHKETAKDFTSVEPFMARCTLDIICETTLGIKLGAQENIKLKYIDSVKRISRNVFDRMHQPWFWSDFIYSFTQKRKQLKKDLQYLHNFHRKIIQDKLKSILNGHLNLVKQKRKAFLDLLLDIYVQDKSLTLEEIREEVDTVTFGGHDSVSVSLSWAIFLIGHHKEVQTKIQEELHQIFGEDIERPATSDDVRNMKYLECVIKEGRRLYPPVPFYGRNIEEDTDVCGYTIPAGASCGVVAYELHRDPEIYPNPEKFDPDRFLPENSTNRHPYAYLPFSGGPRNCIGQRYAAIEEKVVMSTILRNFTVESLDPRDRVLPVPEITLRPAVPIRIKFRPRYDGNINELDSNFEQTF